VSSARTSVGVLVFAALAGIGLPSEAASEGDSRGARIVFESDRANPHPDAGPIGSPVDSTYYEIFSMDRDGKNVRRLTKNRAEDGSPACSQDGKRIAFNSDRSGNIDIYVMDVNDGAEKRLTTDAAIEVTPTWSPDGKWIAFAKLDKRSGYAGDIWVMSSDGNRKRRLTQGKSDDRVPAWSPRGDRIGFMRSKPTSDYLVDLLVVRPSGGPVRPLIRNAYSDSFSWSPDGSKIVLARATRADVSESRMWIASAKSRRWQQELTDVPDLASPAWSPDGAQIALSTYDGVGVIAANGGAISELVGSGVRGYWNFGPAWCPS
jgi:TolB protein